MSRHWRRHDVLRAVPGGSRHRANGPGPLRRTLAVLCAGVVIAAASLVVPGDTASAQQTFRMRIQAAVPSGAMSFEMLQRFAKRLDVMSGGRLRVEVLAEGAIVPAPQIMDAVQRGVLEAGFAWPQFWAGKHPATALFSNTPVWPMAGLDELTHFSWMYEGGGLELYHELLQKVIGVNVVSVFVTPSGWQNLGWFRAPIENMEAFRKVKYRSPPGLAGEIFKEAGVSAVSLPGGEIIPAAERGAIGGAEWINPVEDIAYGFHQAFKYYYLASIHQFIDVGEVIINGDFWKKLSPDLQEMVRTAGKATLIETFNNDILRNARTVKTLREKHGITIAPTPHDINVELMKAAGRVLERRSAENPFFKKVVDSQREFALTVAPWWGQILRMYFRLSEDAVIR